MLTENEVIRLLCRRFYLLAQSVSEVDYPRIEELCYLLQAVMAHGALRQPVDLDRPVSLRELIRAEVEGWRHKEGISENAAFLLRQLGVAEDGLGAALRSYIHSLEERLANLVVRQAVDPEAFRREVLDRIAQEILSRPEDLREVVREGATMEEAPDVDTEDRP